MWVQNAVWGFTNLTANYRNLQLWRGRKNADSCSLASPKNFLKWLETLQFFPKHGEDILRKQRDVTMKASSLEKESCQTPLRVDCNWISDLANQISWWRKGWNEGDEDGRVERNIGENSLQKLRRSGGLSAVTFDVSHSNLDWCTDYSGWTHLLAALGPTRLIY